MSARCEAVDKTEQWPYVRRCVNVATFFGVSVPMEVGTRVAYEPMDLCDDHAEQVNRS